VKRVAVTSKGGGLSFRLAARKSNVLRPQYRIWSRFPACSSGEKGMFNKVLV
jgi:hypothetical protein